MTKRRAGLSAAVMPLRWPEARSIGTSPSMHAVPTCLSPGALAMPEGSGARASITTDLFDPVQLGPTTLSNRIVMAPLTRSRADDASVPGELQATYYAQRASAGLIITEATSISAQGKATSARPGSGRPSRSPAGASPPRRCTTRAGTSSCSSGTWAASPTPICSPATGSPWRRARCAPKVRSCRHG
jgi:NADH:flavin oxidoreductase / NADH oxidase family